MAAPSACGEARPAAAAALIGWRRREAGRGGGPRLSCGSAGRGGQRRAAIAPRLGATAAASGGSRRKGRGRGEVRRGVRWRRGKAARGGGAEPVRGAGAERSLGLKSAENGRTALRR